MEKTNSRFPTLPIIVAVITGSLAGIPSVLNYINTPRKIEAEVRKIREQSEAQLKLQRDKEVAVLLSRLDDPRLSNGAVLSLAVLGGESIAPILVGQLRHSAIELARLQEAGHRRAKAYAGTQNFIETLRHALVTIGLPALPNVVDLNREIKFTIRHLETMRQTNLSNPYKRKELSREIAVQREANKQVKDVLRTMLFRVASRHKVEQEKSPIAGAGIDLADVDLSETSLIRLNLAEVDLRNADLGSALLYECDLRGAKLGRANLMGSGLWANQFRGADLREAYLDGSELREGQDLTCEQLTQAKNWESAYRDPELGCGAPIPEAPSDESWESGEEPGESNE